MCLCVFVVRLSCACRALARRAKARQNFHRERIEESQNPQNGSVQVDSAHECWDVRPVEETERIQRRDRCRQEDRGDQKVSEPKRGSSAPNWPIVTICIDDRKTRADQNQGIPNDSDQTPCAYAPSDVRRILRMLELGLLASR